MTNRTLKSKAFVFDLDGTLIDTTPHVIKFWTNLAIENNLDPEKILETSHGRRTIETLERWIPSLATKEKVMELESRLSLEKDGVTVLPGVREILSSILADDWTIFTACTSTMASARLEQFSIVPAHDIATGDKVNNGKPHPEGYLLAAKMINRNPKDCIVFEDAPAGVRAAIAAGMQCIACTTTHTAEQLREAGATVIVDYLTHVGIERQSDDTYNVTVDNVIE
ncbi:HAD-like domain-containing protein [Sporodiniella umbellata]|nr:HAD-like domain-containing protein [Sporodiniella umbellata]